MRIAITGASGFVGSYIRKRFEESSIECIVLGRNDSDEVWGRSIAQANVVINLAGASVFKRWTSKNRNVILQSRIQTTRRVVSIMDKYAGLGQEKLLISASAIGIYPDNTDHGYDERSVERSGSFLADVVAQWETEVMKAANQSVRVVIARLGVVVGKEGGFLVPLFPLFKWGLGAKLGNGKQLMSFIHVEDIFRAFLFFINEKQSEGVYNLVAPKPVTNQFFTRAFAQSLHRPVFLFVPAFLLKLIYGDASRILLNGAAVYPAKLLGQGFIFEYPNIESALREVVS